MSPIIFGMALPWLLLGFGCWIAYQLAVQNGRILLRLEAIESRLNRGAPAAEAPAGLPAGTDAPDFELADLSGERWSLSRFKGRPIVAIFFNPKCGFCSRMVPDLAAAAAEVGDAADRPLPVIVTTGDPEENRKLFAAHEVRFPVLIQAGTEVTARYKVRGTPSGYLIDAEGKIAADLAVGAPDLLGLIRDPASARRAAPAAKKPCACDRNADDAGPRGKANKGVGSSKLNRTGLKPGTLAPDFRLPTVDGGEATLGEHLGRKVLLVFSDPDCGPCNKLAPELDRLARGRSDLDVLMVSRGDLEANRRKVEELGLTFPVALQKNWEISMKYAYFATPIGYLIDEDGVVASEVAVGHDAVLSLAAEVRPKPAHPQTSRNGRPTPSITV